MSGSIVHSLRVKPNWASRNVPVWTDVTETLDMGSVPSIQISAERQDIPLLTTASDLTLTLNNGDNRWDDIFDIVKIVGTLPPPPNGTIRAPLLHYGKIMLCRRATETAQWQVVFFGYVDPKSIIFNRSDKTITLTAYAPAKLLELGNAERVNKITQFAPARPFVATTVVLVHPVAPPGSPLGANTDDSWWLMINAQQLNVSVGDQFKAIHNITSWAEGLVTVPYDNSAFTIVAVSPSGNQVYVQTAENPNLTLGNGTAMVEWQNPWWRSRTWESLVSDLGNEVNNALIAAGIASNIFQLQSQHDALQINTSGLPLLPTTSQLFAQLINMADVPPPINGVAYMLYSTVDTLLYSQELSPTTSRAFGKRDILGPNVLGPPGLSLRGVFAPTPIGGYLPGPDDGLPMRLPSPNRDIGAFAIAADAASHDMPWCGKDWHSFRVDPIASNNYYHSSHWARTPSAYLTGGSPRHFYRIYARGVWVPKAGATAGHFNKGLQVTDFQTADGGATFTVNRNSVIITAMTSPDDPTNPGPTWAYPDGGPSQQPDLKIYQLSIGGGSFLYCWTNPMLPNGTSSDTSTTANVVAGVTDTPNPSVFFTPAISFTPAGNGAPTLRSGFVTEGIGGGVWFFCDRQDRTRVDFYYWDGATMSPGNLVDGFGNQAGVPSLIGGDFINAMVDASGPPPFPPRRKLYVIVGSTLYVMNYIWTQATGTLAIQNYQTVPIDQVNYDQFTEDNSDTASRPGETVWMTGPVFQNNPGEPDYSDASDSLIVASHNAIYIVSDVAVNLVDYADFEQLSVAGAMQQLIAIRGYQMLSGPDQLLIADPSTYDPIPVVTFRERLIPTPTIIDLSVDPTNPSESATEACQDGIWFLNYVAVGVQNSKLVPQIGPFYNDAVLVTLAGVKFSMNPARNPGSSALLIDNRLISTSSFAKLLANIFAQDFLVPQPSATIVVRDPYITGQGRVLQPLDVVKYLKRSPDSASNVALFGQGRVFTIDYGLDDRLLTLKVG